MFPSTLVLDMRVPADRALGGSVMELLAYPTLRHAQSAADRSARHITEARCELRRLLNLPTSTHPLDRMMQPPGWQWENARRQCFRIRNIRRSHAAALARVTRMTSTLNQKEA
jgi:hypothetical protein